MPKKSAKAVKRSLQGLNWPGKELAPKNLPDPKLSENAVEILKRRYFIKDSQDRPLEKPQDLFWRVAYYIANADLLYDPKTKIEKTAESFYRLMYGADFLPNSPTLRGAGREIQQLSACFVLPIEDSMEGIFQTLRDTAMIHKGGGGTGFSFGRLRPEGDKVGSTDGIAGGPISFMRIFDTLAQEVMQGGVRVGANMSILPIYHPDIEKFIHCKEDGVSFRNFNLSVAITDDFMKKVAKNEEYELINPRNQKVTGKLNAKEVFDEIVANAWKNGDPGVIYIDAINRDNPTPELGQIESTNPCGEQPLLPYESCNLGSINLSNMVDKNNKIDWEKLRRVTNETIHFLDNVIDVNKYNVREVEEITKSNRKIGLGIMGFADLLAKMEIPYASEKAIAKAGQIMSFIQKESKKASRELAETRGSFPNIEKSVYKKDQPMRNATTITIAPTGTLSLIGNCSGGIEPFFALAYKKKSLFKKDGTAALEQTYINEVLEQVAKKEGFYSKKLIDEIIAKGSLKDVKDIPEKYKKIFATAGEIEPIWHVRMQAAFQEFTDNAVSKTINFANEATIEDVRQAYLLAYKTKCKGITIYRDGSRDVQVLTKGNENASKATIDVQPLPRENKLVPRERPPIVYGTTYKMKTAYGNLYVTVNDDEQGEPFEVFTHIGKAGGFFAAKVEAISRLISLALRVGVKPGEITDQLKGIRGPSPIWTDEGLVLSIPDALSKIMEKHLKKEQRPLDLQFQNGTNKQNDENKAPEAPQPTKSVADLGLAPACPDCGGMLEMGEGCLKCSSCGFSKCG